MKKFHLSKRAAVPMKESPESVQEEYFPALPLDIFSEWAEVEGRMIGDTAYIKAWTSMETETPISERMITFTIRGDGRTVPSGYVSWPSELGDFGLDLWEDKRYTFNFNLSTDLAIVSKLVSALGKLSVAKE